MTTHTSPAPPGLPPGRERLLLLTLAGIQLAHIVDFMVMMPLGPILMHELTIGTHEFGLLVSSYTFTAAASGVLIASFIDRFERKRLLLTMLALFGFATLACALATDHAALLVARGAAGAFGGVLGALVQTMVGDLIPFERRGRASATIMAAFSISTIAGVPAALWLANHFGWRFPFVLVACLTAIFHLIAWRLLPRLRDHLAAAATRRHPLAAIGQTLRDTNHLKALGFLFLVIFASFMVIPYITLYLVGNVGVSQDDIPLIYLFGGAASLFSSRWIGRQTDRHGKVRVYRLVAIGSLLPLLAITHLPPAPLATVLTITTLFFILVPGRMVPAMAIVTSAAQPALRGTFMAINASLLQLATGTATLIGGLIVASNENGIIVHYDRSGWLATALTLIALAAVGRVRMR